jgi:hypothetical protein
VPSTILITGKFSSSYYSLNKLKFENYLKKQNKKLLNCYNPRLPEIHTRQNLSFLKRNLPTFTQLLNNDIIDFKKLFF